MACIEIITIERHYRDRSILIILIQGYPAYYLAQVGDRMDFVPQKISYLYLG